jgi:pimeloyl-ACP methyl ester carboxylesterase
VTRAQELGLLESDNPVSDFEIPPIQYIKSDDAYIAYQVIGDGPVDMLYMSGFASHIEYAWEEPRLAQTMRHLANHARLIIMDKRGSGLSDRVLDSPSLEQTAADMEAVLDAVGSKEAVIAATCEGAPAASLAAVNNPDRILGLIMLNPVVVGSRTEQFPWAMPCHLWEQVFEAVEQEWGGPYKIDYLVPTADEYLRTWWAKYLRLAVSPGAAVAAFQILSAIDMTAIMPQITVPTLLVHRRDNNFVRIEASRHVADLIPMVRYVELPGTSHLWWWDGEDALDEIVSFLKRMTD